MAIKELFYDQRPVALLNPKAAQRIDRRFVFTRDSIATYFDQDQNYRIAEAGQPRFGGIVAGEAAAQAGLIVEKESTNWFLQSQNLAVGGSASRSTDSGNYSYTDFTSGGPNNQGYVRLTCNSTSTTWPITISYAPLAATVPQFTPFIFSVWAKTTVPGTPLIATNPDVRSDTEPESYTLTSEWTRYKFAFRVASQGATALRLYRTLALTAGQSLDLAMAQIEVGQVFTSYIPVTTAPVTRAAELLYLNSSQIPGSGSIYVDSQSPQIETGSTLISLKNAANEQINLAIEERSELYNSSALVYSIQGTIKPTLPFPVPTTDRERNIITWGANNYQYTTSSARFAQSLSSLVPNNLTRLTIGSDSVDPTKAFTGYINAVYLYSGELTPAVAEALVRGELDPINADTFVPTGPLGSLSLIINTQGELNNGDTVFTLPTTSPGTDNDIVITWGDNTESGLKGAAAELGAPGLQKTYSSPGIYSIFIKGQLDGLRFLGDDNAKDLEQIVNWGTSANGNDVFLSPSTLNSAFYGCSQLDFSSTARTVNLPNTSAVTDWFRAFRDCSNISGVFPQFNFSSATTLREAFANCSSLTAFTPAGNQTQNVTDFTQAWLNCSGLTAFPLINTSSGTNFTQAWQSCTGLQQFPQIVTSSATTLSSTWANCTNLLAFPSIVTSSVTIFNSTWSNCNSLSVFPPINTSSGTQFNSAWSNCSGLSAFPNLTLSSGTTFIRTWSGCSGLAAFPPLDFSNGTNFEGTWLGCTGLSVFPAITTSNGTNFGSTWSGCTGLSAFPQLDFDAATGAATDPSNVNTGFYNSWRNCTSLTTFPANRFNNTTCNRFLGAWLNCALDVTSIENILVSINAAGTSDGNLSLEGGTNANRATWTVTAENAYNALIGRGWTITFNP